MALSINDPETERLARQVSKITGESQTDAIRSALAERKERLTLRLTRRQRRNDLLRLLEEENWPSIPAKLLGKKLSRFEKERFWGENPVLSSTSRCLFGAQPLNHQDFRSLTTDC